MKNKEKKAKPVFVDDGRTIADMDCEAIAGYKSKEQRKKHEELKALNLTKEERKAIYRGTFKFVIPYLLCFGGIMIALLCAFYFAMRG